MQGIHIRRIRIVTLCMQDGHQLPLINVLALDSFLAVLWEFDIFLENGQDYSSDHFSATHFVDGGLAYILRMICQLIWDPLLLRYRWIAYVHKPPSPPQDSRTPHECTRGIFLYVVSSTIHNHEGSVLTHPDHASRGVEYITDASWRPHKTGRYIRGYTGHPVTFACHCEWTECVG